MAQGKERPEQIVTLDCANKNISDGSGISKLTNLTRLNLSGNRLIELDLRENAKLSELIANDNLISHVQLPHEYLNTVDLSGNNLTTFNLTDASRLKLVDVSNNRLTSLYLTTSTISNLWAEGNRLTSITLTDLPNLRSLNLRDNQFSVLDLTHLSQPTHVDLSQNPLQNIDIRPIQSLKVRLMNDTQIATDTLQALRTKMPTSNIVSTQSLSDLIYPDPVFRRCVEAHITDDLGSVNEINCDRYKIGLLSHSTAIQNADGLTYLFLIIHVSQLLRSTHYNLVTP